MAPLFPSSIQHLTRLNDHQAVPPWLHIICITSFTPQRRGLLWNSIKTAKYLPTRVITTSTGRCAEEETGTFPFYQHAPRPKQYTYDSPYLRFRRCRRSAPFQGNFLPIELQWACNHITFFLPSLIIPLYCKIQVKCCEDR